MLEQDADVRRRRGDSKISRRDGYGLTIAVGVRGSGCGLLITSKVCGSGRGDWDGVEARGMSIIIPLDRNCRATGSRGPCLGGGCVDKEIRLVATIKFRNEMGLQLAFKHVVQDHICNILRRYGSGAARLETRR